MNLLRPFHTFKHTEKQRITALGSSSETAYQFFRDKAKLLPAKSQLQWYSALVLKVGANAPLGALATVWMTMATNWAAGGR